MQLSSDLSETEVPQTWESKKAELLAAVQKACESWVHDMEIPTSVPLQDYHITSHADDLGAAIVNRLNTVGA